LHQAGIENVVASSGTALTHGQIRMIHRFSENITILYDGDTAGIKAALRGIDLLLEDGMNVKVVLLPEGEDPDSFARKQNAEKFNAYILEHEVDFIRFKTQLLLEEASDDPIKRSGLISNIVQSISLIPDNIIRSVYIQDCSNLLSIKEEVLIREVNKLRLKNYEQRKELKAREDSRKERDNIDQPELIDAVVDFEEKNFNGVSSKNPYDRFERELIRYIIRYGTTPIYQRFKKEKKRMGKEVVEVEVLEEEGPTVIEFIKYDLERDNIHFSNLLYRKIFEEAYSKSEDERFDPARYFIAMSDQKIGKLATDLISDKYHLSKIHAKLIGEEADNQDSRLLEKNSLEQLVPRATTELKNAYVLQKIEEVKKAMKLSADEDTVLLIQELQQLQVIKKELSKILGERIVLKI